MWKSTRAYPGHGRRCASGSIPQTAIAHHERGSLASPVDTIHPQGAIDFGCRGGSLARSDGLRVRNQVQAVADVQEVGGSIWFENDQPRFVEHWLSPDRIPSTTAAGPDWLCRLLGDDYFRNVVQIDFKAARQSRRESPNFGQLGPRLGKLPKLETIRFEMDFPDEVLLDFVQSSNLRRLKHLYVDGLVTDKGVKHIGELSGLETLNLRYTEITDSGAVHLANLKDLHSLFLYSSELTERGVAIVLAFPGLKKLILYDCAITAEELATLAEHHPDVNAEIYFTRRRNVVE